MSYISYLPYQTFINTSFYEIYNIYVLKEIKNVIFYIKLRLNLLKMTLNN